MGQTGKEIVKRESIHISISAAGRWLPYNN
jgi:hypothetical protein